jgi:hypothetical protein
MLIGLTFRKDPLARLFALASPELEQSAYPIFVLQRVVADLWGTFYVKVSSRTPSVTPAKPRTFARPLCSSLTRPNSLAQPCVQDYNMAPFLMTLSVVSFLFYLMVAAPAAALWLRCLEQPPEEEEEEGTQTAAARWRLRGRRWCSFAPLWLVLVLMVVVSLVYRPVPPAYEPLVPVYVEVVIGAGRPAVDVRLNLTTSYAGLETGEVRHG